MLRSVGPQGCSWGHPPSLPIQGTEGPLRLLTRSPQSRGWDPVSRFSLPWGEAESEGITQDGAGSESPLSRRPWAAERKLWPSELPLLLGVGKGCQPLSPQSLWL